MAGARNWTTRGNAKGAHRRTPRSREPYGWLGAAAVTLGVGAALSTGSGLAHADDTGTAPPSSTDGARPGHHPLRAVRTAVATSAHSSTPTPTLRAATHTDDTHTADGAGVGRHRLDASRTGVANSIDSLAPKALRPFTRGGTPPAHALDMATPLAIQATSVEFPHVTRTAPAAEAAAGSALEVVRPAANAIAPTAPGNKIVTVLAQALSNAGLNTPTAPPDPLGALLWKFARRVETVIGVVPSSGTPVIGTPAPTTGAIVVDPALTTRAGPPVTYSAPTTSTGGGTVTIDAATGEFTYTPTTAQRQSAVAGTTDTVTITATNGLATTTQTITVPVDTVPVIDAVHTNPGIGNTWVSDVTVHDANADRTVAVTVVPVDPDHVTVTGDPGGPYTVTVTDAAWAAAHPGSQILATVTATDSGNATVSQTVDIGTVNNATATGANSGGQTDIPALPAGMTYTQIAAGPGYTVLLRSDATVVVAGRGTFGMPEIPVPPPGITYTQVAAGEFAPVLLRSDGTAIGLDYSQPNLPPLPDDVTYTQVAASLNNTVLLRSDGTAVAVGDSYVVGLGATDIPELPDGLTYTQVAAGWYHTVLLRSDGTVVAVGDNAAGGTDIPALADGVKYTQVAAGGYHTVLLRSDGTAVNVGGDGFGDIVIPALPDGVTYTQVSTRSGQTVLLRSDGTAVTVSLGSTYTQTEFPVPAAGVVYTQVAAGGGHTVLLSAVDTA